MQQKPDSVNLQKIYLEMVLLFHQKYWIFYTLNWGSGSEWNPALLHILSNMSRDLHCHSPPGAGAVLALTDI